MYAWLSEAAQLASVPACGVIRAFQWMRGAVLWSLFVDSSLCRLHGTAAARQQLYQQFGCSTTQAVSWLAAA